MLTKNSVAATSLPLATPLLPLAHSLARSQVGKAHGWFFGRGIFAFFNVPMLRFFGPWSCVCTTTRVAAVI